MNAKHTPKQPNEENTRKSRWKQFLEKVKAFEKVIDYDPVIDSFERFDYLANRLDEIETRIAALEASLASRGS